MAYKQTRTRKTSSYESRRWLLWIWIGNSCCHFATRPQLDVNFSGRHDWFSWKNHYLRQQGEDPSCPTCLRCGSWRSFSSSWRREGRPRMVRLFLNNWRRRHDKRSQTDVYFQRRTGCSNSSKWRHRAAVRRRLTFKQKCTSAATNSWQPTRNQEDHHLRR